MGMISSLPKTQSHCLAVREVATLRQSVVIQVLKNPSTYVIYIKFAYADRLSAPTVQPLRISTVGIKGKCFVLKEWALRLILTKENI